MLTKRNHAVPLIRAAASNPDGLRALIHLFSALLAGSNPVSGGDPPAAQVDAPVELWEDEEYLYIEATLPEASPLFIDIYIDGRRLFMRLAG